MNSPRRLVVATLMGIGFGWVAFAPNSPFLRDDFARRRPNEQRSEHIEFMEKLIITDEMEDPVDGIREEGERDQGDERSQFLRELGIKPDPKWPRVFCMINTMPGHDGRIKAVNNTWVQHCDGHIFTTTRTNDTENEHDYWTFDFHDEKHNINNHIWLWDRLRAGMKKLYKEKGESYDWFLKADDDTFVVIENLKEYLKSQSADQPLYLATMLRYMDHHLTKRPKDFIYPSGGSGYILSREALKRTTGKVGVELEASSLAAITLYNLRFTTIGSKEVKEFVKVIEESDGEKCRNTSFLHEDTEVGWCLRNAGVTAISSVDHTGAHMMLPIDIMDIVHEKKAQSGVDRGWARQSVHARLRVGKPCCSTNLITAHYVNELLMTTYYYLVYGVRLAGRAVLL